MAFGSSVTSGAFIASSNSGYVVAFDLSSREFSRFLAARAYSPPSTFSGTEETVDDEMLYSYLSSDNPPDISCSVVGQNIYVFLKSSVHPYVSSTQVAFWFYRSAENVSNLSDFCDVPQPYRVLFSLTVLKNMYLQMSRQVPRFISDQIASERKSLGLWK